MGSVGDCYDNGLCESFFASLECELLDRRSFQTHSEARMAVFQYIEGWYNTHRRHSSIGYYAPIAFERRYRACLRNLFHLTRTMRDSLDSGVRRNDVIEIWRQVRHLVERRNTEH